MTSETYLRKANELKEKIKNTNPRFINKIAEMKEEEKRLRAKAKEKMEQERLKSTKATTEGKKITRTMDAKSKDEVPWGQKYIFGYSPAVEYFKCPYCTESMHQNEALHKESGNIFIFQCKKCNRKAKVILNNVKCKYCNRYTIPSRLVREKYCSLACYEADNGIIRKTPEQDNSTLTSPSKEAKLEAGLRPLGLRLADESSKGIIVDVSVEYDDEGNPHIDPNKLSKAISKAVQDAPYEFNPVVAKKIKMRQRIKEIDNIITNNKGLSKSELSALKKEKATLEKDVEK